MAMTHPASAATRLGCGRDIDEVWESIDAPPSVHELACPYCQAARASLTELAAATKDLTAADRANPLLRVPAQVLSTIMTIARTEVRRGRTIPLEQPAPDLNGHPPGPTALNISEQAVAAVVRQASDQLDGVQARRCSVQPAIPDQSPPAPSNAPKRPTRLGTDTTPTEVTVALGVSVSRGVSIPSLIPELRRRIRSAVTAQVGLTVSRIDIHVEDIHDA
jgi:uncharacterized alkaline shock family protein YloU